MGGDKKKYQLRLVFYDAELHKYLKTLSVKEKSCVLTNALYRSLVVNKRHKTAPIIELFGQSGERVQEPDRMDVRLTLNDEDILTAFDEITILSAGKKEVFNSILRNLILIEMFGHRSEAIPQQEAKSNPVEEVSKEQVVEKTETSSGPFSTPRTLLGDFNTVDTDD